MNILGANNARKNFLSCNSIIIMYKPPDHYENVGYLSSYAKENLSSYAKENLANSIL